MLEDNLKKFVKSLYKYLVTEDEYIPGLLVKKHFGNLQMQGDFSFPNIAKSWQEFLSDEQLQRLDGTLLKCINKDVADLMNVSQVWEISIVKATEIRDRVHLFLDRLKTVQIGFQNAKRNNEGILQILKEDASVIKLDPSCRKPQSVTFLRLKCLTEVVKNLYLINIHPQVLDVIVTWKSYNESDDVNAVSCGIVLNAKTGAKEKTVTSGQYTRIRQDELTLIAQHKYGVRVSTEAKWQEYISHLGECAVTFELLQTRCSSPVKIYFDASGGSTKRIAFILYNCARMETIIRTFNEKVVTGYYPYLPSLENIDLSLLSDEDEWCLVFTFIMGLPALMESSVQRTGNKYEFRPHLICNFVDNMVKKFSHYYRRVKILTEPRKHLLPVMFARIHMLIILNHTLKICLKILNIKSVSQMYTVFLSPNPYLPVIH